MFITDDGMIIDAKFIARENAPAPMLVTVFGMFIDVMLVALKALEPMLISCEPVAKIIDVKFIAFWNALAPMLVTDAGMVKEIVVFPDGY